MKTFAEWRNQQIVESDGFSDENIFIANKTCRKTGGVGGKPALVPRIVKDIAEPEHTILDFGAGTHAVHAQDLRAAGLNVTAHDFGSNVIVGLHDPKALRRKYDIVYASNVLNVQNDDEMLSKTLNQIAKATKPKGRAILNLPIDPRKGAWVGTKDDLVKLQLELEKRYNIVERNGFVFYAFDPK